MNTKTFQLLALAIFALATAPSTSQAQIAAESIPPEDVQYEINFEGGTIVEYVTLISKVSGPDNPIFNLIVANSARDFVLPSIKVTTTIEGAIEIMSACSTNDTHVMVDDLSVGNVKIVSVDSAAKPSVTVVNVKQILVSISKEALLSAIEIGMEMNGAGSAVTVKLHEETGLLFVRGPGDSTDLIRKIIDQLQSS